MMTAQEHFAPILDHLSRGAMRYFDAPEVILTPVKLIQTQVSSLLKVSVRLHGRESGAYVKVPRPAGGVADDTERMRRIVRREHEAMQRYSVFAQGFDGVAVAKPIACLPEFCALVTKEASGPSLNAIAALNTPMWRHSSATAWALEDRFQRLGAWAAFCESIREQGASHTRESREAYLDVRLTELADDPRSSIDAAGRRLVLGYFERLCGGLTESDWQPFPVHGDLHPGNVLVPGPDQSLVIIDFSDFGVGLRFYDLAYMYLHLAEFGLKPWMHPGAISLYQNALLRGFGDSALRDHNLFKLCLLQIIVVKLVQATRRAGAGSSVKSILKYRWVEYRLKRWLRGLVANDKVSF